MSKDIDPDYYAARLRAERDAAARAKNEAARATHLALAESYHKVLSASRHLRAAIGTEGCVPSNSPQNSISNRN